MQPCSVLETDEIYPPFVGNRKWEERYKVVTISNSTNSRIVEVYGHPVYVSDGIVPDIIFFNGYRWAMASSADFGFESTDDEAVAAYFSNDFHGFWSQYTLGFLSSSVGVDSPDNTNIPVSAASLQIDLCELWLALMASDMHFDFRSDHILKRLLYRGTKLS